MNGKAMEEQTVATSAVKMEEHALENKRVLSQKAQERKDATRRFYARRKKELQQGLLCEVTPEKDTPVCTGLLHENEELIEDTMPSQVDQLEDNGGAKPEKQEQDEKLNTARQGIEEDAPKEGKVESDHAGEVEPKKETEHEQHMRDMNRTLVWKLKTLQEGTQSKDGLSDTTVGATHDVESCCSEPVSEWDEELQDRRMLEVEERVEKMFKQEEREKPWSRQRFAKMLNNRVYRRIGRQKENGRAIEELRGIICFKFDKEIDDIFVGVWLEQYAEWKASKVKKSDSPTKQRPRYEHRGKQEDSNIPSDQRPLPGKQGDPIVPADHRPLHQHPGKRGDLKILVDQHSLEQHPGKLGKPDILASQRPLHQHLKKPGTAGSPAEQQRPLCQHPRPPVAWTRREFQEKKNRTDQCHDNHDSEANITPDGQWIKELQENRFQRKTPPSPWAPPRRLTVKKHSPVLRDEFSPTLPSVRDGLTRDSSPAMSSEKPAKESKTTQMAACKMVGQAGW